ncbi:WD40-repeat-containing domain protein, partial [Blakeslea trispora]
MTPVTKSAALPIPNARRSLRTTSSSSSSIGHSVNGMNGLHVLTSPQKVMTASGGNSSPYLPNSPSFMPATPTQQQTHDIGMPNYDSLSSSLTNNPTITTNGGSVGSISSLFGRGSNLYNANSLGGVSSIGGGKSTPQLSSSIVRTMSSSTSSKPKNHLSKTNSTFVLRFVVHENLQKLLSSRGPDDEFLFFNIGSSFIWVDPKNKSKEPLSRIVFSKSYPICHDINEATRSEDHLDIIIGFSTGDIIWYDPLNSKYVRLNKAGCLVNSAVSMIKWIPGSDDLFIAAFSNGAMMIMDKERDDQSFNIPEPTSLIDSHFTAFRPHKSPKYNPVSFWKMSSKGLTDFAFSPDGIHLAVTGMDGQMRVIDFRNERLLDVYSSYYGKFNCVDWSPDGRYILTGGEDDLVSLWSFLEKRMVARCPGHKSWVTGVAFDRWKCDEQTYRFASVGEDCNLIFWDFSYSALQKPKHSRVVTASLTSSTLKKANEPTSPVLTSPVQSPPQPAPIPLAPLIVVRKKSLKAHRLFRGFSSP